MDFLVRKLLAYQRVYPFTVRSIYVNGLVLLGKTLHTGNPILFFADFDGENHGNSGFDFPFQSSDSSDFGDGSLPNMSTRRDRCSKFSAQQNDPW